MGAALLSMSAFALTEAKLVTKVSLSGVLFMTALLWRAHHIQQGGSKAASRHKGAGKLARLQEKH